MEPDFWRARWGEGRIGFHEGRPNELLVRYAARLGEARRVLVPLCGKSVDLAYLASLGHEVVGVELVEDAVRAFFSEQGLTPGIDRTGNFTRYTAPRLTLLCGDVFETTRELLGPIDALYDRAALIALPAPLRDRYAAHVRTLLPAGSPALVVTLEYPDGLFTGPPFSVPDSILRSRFEGATIERLESKTNVRVGGKDGGPGTIEHAYALTF